MAGSSSGSSQSTSVSTSGSSSYIPDYPQSALLQAIAAYAGQLGEATYNWGQQQYAKTSALTDQNINSYLTTSAQSLQNAQNDEQRYRTLFQPEENQLVQDANSYNSLDRQQHEMGRAEAQTGQAMDAGRQNHIRELQSYGIDPSAGRYDELDRADQLTKSAAQAASGQQAYENTAATGRQLRADAIQAGAHYPGQITNEQNTALQGYAGAENSNLANANTGVALQNSANNYLTTGESLKYPGLGTTSQSQSTSKSTSNNSSVSSDGSKSGNDNSKDPAGGNGSSGGSPSGGGARGGGGGNSGQSGNPGQDFPGENPTGDPYYNGGDFGGGVGYGGNSNDLGSNNPFYDPYGATGPLGDNTGEGSSSTYGDPGGQFYDPYSAYASGSGGDYSYDNSSVLASDFGAGGGDYARGGTVIDQRAGGHVPASASPSGGQQVDDVRAHLNTNEFVIPRDVAMWKGQEFFQKLIADARKNNAMAAAKPRFSQPGGQNVQPAR